MWAVVLRNAIMASRNVFFFFELLFWPIVGVLSIGLMARFLELTPAQDVVRAHRARSRSRWCSVCQLDVAYAVLLRRLVEVDEAPVPGADRRAPPHHWAPGWSGSCAGSLVFVLLAALGVVGVRLRRRCARASAPLPTFLLGCFLTAWIVGVVGVRAHHAASATARRPSRGRASTSCSCWPASTIPSRCCRSPAAAVAAAIPLTYFLDAYRAHFGFAAEFAHPIVTGAPARPSSTSSLAHWALVAAVQSARRSGCSSRCRSDHGHQALRARFAPPPTATCSPATA